MNKKYTKQNNELSLQSGSHHPNPLLFPNLSGLFICFRQGEKCSAPCPASAHQALLLHAGVCGLHHCLWLEAAEIKTLGGRVARGKDGKRSQEPREREKWYGVGKPICICTFDMSVGYKPGPDRLWKPIILAQTNIGTVKDAFGLLHKRREKVHIFNERLNWKQACSFWT